MMTPCLIFDSMSNVHIEEGQHEMMRSAPFQSHKFSRGVLRKQDFSSLWLNSKKNLSPEAPSTACSVRKWMKATPVLEWLQRNVRDLPVTSQHTTAAQHTTDPL